ncbi:uncharacterized protein TNCV_1154201 [Trichonephila clavipes]|nr:uncharacterized protein TNCV_1154201 [Trichonephila clavipes]
MANSRMTFCKVCGFKECHHISRLFCLHPQSLWINWLSSLIRFLRLLVRPRLSVLPQLFLHHPSHLQPTMDSLARQIQELSLQVAQLTRERNSSRHQRYSSDRRRSHSRSRSVNRGSGICYYHRRYKEQARKCVSPCAFVQKKKKRVSSVIAGMAEPSKHTSRLFLLDRKSVQKFLIDSGSEICVIPPSPTMNKSPQSNFSLFAANNTKIPAYGMVRKELNLGLRRPFIWTFIIADVSSTIIGADFLKHFNLLIDLKKKGWWMWKLLFSLLVF